MPLGQTQDPIEYELSKYCKDYGLNPKECAEMKNVLLSLDDPGEAFASALRLGLVWGARAACDGVFPMSGWLCAAAATWFASKIGTTGSITGCYFLPMRKLPTSFFSSPAALLDELNRGEFAAANIPATEIIVYSTFQTCFDGETLSIIPTERMRGVGQPPSLEILTRYWDGTKSPSYKGPLFLVAKDYDATEYIGGWIPDGRIAGQKLELLADTKYKRVPFQERFVKQSVDPKLRRDPVPVPGASSSSSSQYPAGTVGVYDSLIKKYRILVPQ